jgi:hypothetical protein
MFDGGGETGYLAIHDDTATLLGEFFVRLIVTKDICDNVCT